MKKKIILVSGDPNSINSEIIFKTWKFLDSKLKKSIYLIASYDLLYDQFKKLQFNIKIKKVKNIDEQLNSDTLKIINIPLTFKNSFSVKPDSSAKYVKKSLNLAHRLANLKEVKGIINCPINKKLIKNKINIGVTEYLAKKNNIKDHSEVMMLYNKNLSVVPITTHININQVNNKIKKDLIFKKIFTLNHFYKKLFKKKPKIGILGLNPHNGEFEKDSAEKKTIEPAINYLRRKGFYVTGPLVADTIFINKYKKYDVIVGMYHDQVLGPFKALFKFDAINITLGLKYFRASPDHGPAIDLIKKGKANHLSLFQCIKFINKIN